MKEFIKSIFTTPVNLWTLGQELFVYACVLVILLLIAGVCYGIGIIADIKQKQKNKRRKHDNKTNL